MHTDMRNIVILVYQYSVVVKGIENKLKELGYNVETLSNEFDKISGLAPTTSLFIFYLPMNIEDDMGKLKTLLNVSETVKSLGSKMIIIGEKSSQSEVQLKLPEIIRFEWVSRPIDMEKLNLIVDDAINGLGNTTQPKRILIVDDDPSYAKMVREWIKDRYRVDIVTAGMQAITFLLKANQTPEPVDLILLDYEMPVVDGPQVLQMLRQEPVTENIPVIFLTGLGTKEAVARVMELKPEGYILKTTTRDDLIGYLKKKV